MKGKYTAKLRVRTGTIAFQRKKQSSGFLRTVHLPERWRFSHEARQPPEESLYFFSLSFFLPLLFCFFESMIMFILIPYTGISKFRAESRRLNIYVGVSLPLFSKAPSLPKAHSGSSSAGDLVAADGDGNGLLETIRRDSNRPAGMFQVG